MATTKTKTKSKSTTLKAGTAVTFLGYSDGKGDTFKKGASLKIVGFDPDDNTYAVEDENGEQDSLFATEFEISGAGDVKAKATNAKTAPAKKASTKTAKRKAAPVEEEDEEVEEEEVEAPKSKAKSKTATTKTAKTAAKSKTTKAAKTKTAKEEKEEVVLPAFKATASVKAALAEHDDDAIAAAHDLAESGEATMFALGGVLAHIKRNDLHLAIEGEEEDEDGNALPAYAPGLKGFNAYVENTLGYASRKAAYLVDLYEKFSQITTEAKIAKIGWTKLRELLPLDIDKTNVEEWLEFAKESSTAEVKAEVSKTLVNAGGKLHGNKSTSEKTKLNLILFDDQGKMVEEAFDKAREVIGEEATASQCFVHIVTEWMALDYDEAALAEDEDEDLDEEDDD